MNILKVRTYLIHYLYLWVIIHLLVGLLLPWLKYFPILEPYHNSIESAIFGSNIPEHARQLHLWWMGLFGATVQFASIYMGLLVYVGDKYKLNVIWKGMIVGLLVWAPQDMYVSLQYTIYSHVVMDMLVLIMIIPVLLSLNNIDSKKQTEIKDS